MNDELPNDPNRGIPISDLLKKHGGFTSVVEQKEWFDDRAKPIKKNTDVTFEPGEEISSGDV